LLERLRRDDSTLVEYAKTNGFEPYAYLEILFTEFPQFLSLATINALLPFDATAKSN